MRNFHSPHPTKNWTIQPPIHIPKATVNQAIPINMDVWSMERPTYAKAEASDVTSCGPSMTYKRYTTQIPMFDWEDACAEFSKYL